MHRPGGIRIGEIGESQPADRDPQFARGQKSVIRHRQIGAVTAHRAEPAKRDLFHLKKRAVGELEVGAKKYFPVLVDAAHILGLAEPGKEFRCGCAGKRRFDHGGAQGLYPEAERRARGEGVLGVTVEPVLVEAHRRHDRLSIGLGAGGKGKRHPEEKSLLLPPFDAQAERKGLFRGSVHGAAQSHPDARKAAGSVQRAELRSDHHDAVFVVAQADPRIVAGDRQRITHIAVVEALAAAVLGGEDIAETQYIGE